MKKYNRILSVAVVVMIICSLVLTCCQKQDPEVEIIEVSIKTPKVGSGKGQQFVNVKCKGDWELVLASDSG